MSNYRTRAFLAVLALASASFLVASCDGGEPFQTGDADTDGDDSGWITEDPPFQAQCPVSQIPTDQIIPLDVLVVVDNSRSMSEEQASLASNFPMLIRDMLSPSIDPVTGRPVHFPVSDLHIGVVSTDMGTGGYTVETCSDPIDGDDGILEHAPNPAIAGCDATYPSYLSYESDTLDTAAIDWMATGFGCVATLGSTGCGFEQPLEAAARALDHAVPEGPNAGFLRDDSILVVVLVTDEEDCSVADPAIFNTADATLGHLNLRCYLHPYMVREVETYLDDFLGHHPIDRFYMGAIVGVPPGSTRCEGAGDEIGDCLLDPMMIEQVDAVDPTRLRYSCSTATGNAFPPRRIVTLAESMGSHSVVRSICTEDFSPFVGDLTARLQSGVDESSWHPPDLQLIPASGDPCHCDATCTMIEMLPDSRPCPEGKPCYEVDGPGTGCTMSGDDGLPRSLCVIPQAGSRMKGCVSSDPFDCESPTSVHLADGEGWYYVPTGETGSQIAWNGGIGPAPDSDLFITCCP